MERIVSRMEFEVDGGGAMEELNLLELGKREPLIKVSPERDVLT